MRGRDGALSWPGPGGSRGQTPGATGGGGGAHPSGLLASTGRQASFCQIWVFSQRPSVVTRGSNEDWLCLRHSAVPGISRPAEAPALARKGFLSPTSPGILWEGRQKGEVRSVSSRRSQVER